MDKLVQLGGRKTNIVNEQHFDLTQKYSTWGDKLLQHADVLNSIQNDGVFKPITIQLAPTEGCDSDCFTGDTQIPLLDGTIQTLKNLSEKIQPFWVYSYDIKDHKIKPGLAIARFYKKSKKLLVITLDDGQEIKCTDSHQFLLRDGTYKEVI